MAMRAHRGCFPDALHTADANPMMHAALHAMVETQIASGAPRITSETLSRLEGEGLRRHAALHLLMREMAAQLAALKGDGKVFDPQAWERSCARLGAVTKPVRKAPRLNRRERRKRRKESKDEG